ncbi:hypothetical protein C8R45DRAFT_1138924 [Mycena sanguinolenta]|nr:hypothetical protein C8R45DRAFT_1138924 [Mycena sanguinolenta]
MACFGNVRSRGTGTKLHNIRANRPRHCRRRRRKPVIHMLLNLKRVVKRKATAEMKKGKKSKKGTPSEVTHSNQEAGKKAKHRKRKQEQKHPHSLTHLASSVRSRLGMLDRLCLRSVGIQIAITGRNASAVASKVRGRKASEKMREGRVRGERAKERRGQERKRKERRGEERTGYAKPFKQKPGNPLKEKRAKKEWKGIRSLVHSDSSVRPRLASSVRSSRRASKSRPARCEIVLGVANRSKDGHFEGAHTAGDETRRHDRRSRIPETKREHLFEVPRLWEDKPTRRARQIQIKNDMGLSVGLYEIPDQAGSEKSLEMPSENLGANAVTNRGDDDWECGIGIGRRQNTVHGAGQSKAEEHDEIRRGWGIGEPRPQHSMRGDEHEDLIAKKTGRTQETDQGIRDHSSTSLRSAGVTRGDLDVAGVTGTGKKPVQMGEGSRRTNSSAAAPQTRHGCRDATRMEVGGGARLGRRLEGSKSQASGHRQEQAVTPDISGSVRVTHRTATLPSFLPSFLPVPTSTNWC